MSLRKDLNRTFPGSKFFSSESDGQTQLQHILHAYSCYDPKVGYVQGMNFIAGSLLYHASEEIAFWLFVSLLDDYELRELYLPDMPGLNKHCQILDFILLNSNYKVYEYLKQRQVKIQFLIIDWIFCLFGSSIAIEKIGLFFDYFFESGWIFFYKVIIQIINKHEKAILDPKNSDDVFGSIRRHRNTDQDSIISRIPLINKVFGAEFWTDLIVEASKLKLNESQINELLNSCDTNL